jgi:hypothetical protein
MNWICGLKRLWVLASLAITWLMVCDMWDSCQYPMTWERNGLAAGFCEIPHLGHILNAAAVSLTVSVALFIIGAGIIWVLRGFRQKEPQA